MKTERAERNGMCGESRESGEKRDVRERVERNGRTAHTRVRVSASSGIAGVAQRGIKASCQPWIAL